MTDDQFIEGAIFALPDHVCAAAGAALIAQNIRSERLVPREIMDICRSLGVTDYDDIQPVLALLGYVFAPDTRRNRHVFRDLFTMPGKLQPLLPMNMNQALALGITRTMVKEVTE